MSKHVSLSRCSDRRAFQHERVDVDGGEDTPSSKYLIPNSASTSWLNTVLDNAYVHVRRAGSRRRSNSPDKAALEALSNSADWKRVQLFVLSFSSYMYVLGA